MAERLVSPKPIRRLTYDWFAQTIHPESKIPVGLVPLDFLFKEGIIRFKEGYKFHDVGVGRGKSTEYFLNKIPENLRESMEIVVSEPYIEDPQALISCVGNNVRIIPKDANEAIAQEKNCDGIALVNFIHLVPEDQRKELLENGFDSLNPDGQLLVSSTFIEEGISEGEHDFFNRWMSNIFRSLSRFNENTKEVIKRVKENKLTMWSAEKYKEVVEKTGFKIEVFRMQTMPCTLESIRGICHYKVFTEHILPGIDPRKRAVIATTALKRTWGQMGRGENDISARNTVVIVGRKPKKVFTAA